MVVRTKVKTREKVRIKKTFSKRTFLVVLDQTNEMPSALNYACRWAKDVRGHVALIYVVKDIDGSQGWLAISDIVKNEQRADAKEITAKFSKYVESKIDEPAKIFIREGNIAEQVLKLIKEKKSISEVILAANEKTGSVGPVITHLLDKGICDISIPITIIPYSAPLIK
jgi:hypothetical protein